MSTDNTDGGGRMTDTKLLNSYIKKSGFKKAKIAEKLSISQASLSKKIHNKCEFKQSEIKVLYALLDIEDSNEKDRIFFA